MDRGETFARLPYVPAPKVASDGGSGSASPDADDEEYGKRLTQFKTMAQQKAPAEGGTREDAAKRGVADEKGGLMIKEDQEEGQVRDPSIVCF